MEPDPIPDDVRRFIVQCIPSVPYLEAILLLKDDPAVTWTPRQLASRLYVGEADAMQLLLELQAAEIVAPAPQANTFGFAPATPQMREMFNRVAMAYRRHLIDVTKLIHVKANRKAQHFANAFIWRKES